VSYQNSIKSIAIGSFDGVHLGHQALIARAEAVVIIERNRSVLTPGYQRVVQIQKPSFFYHLEKIKSLSARSFINKLTHDFPQLKRIVVGYDFEFGHQKEGDTTLLKKLFKGEVEVIEEVKYEQISIHSRSIKEFIKNGEISFANNLLGRPYTIKGEVIRGQGLGKKELVPTLNLKVIDYLLPKEGVYATQTKIGNTWLSSISFLGHRLSTDGLFAIETHLIDQTIEQVKGEVEIKFIAYIRANQKFETLSQLKSAIAQDIQQAKESLL
jgi:riboflavin kinase/FMN adenylyltransferase